MTPVPPSEPSFADFAAFERLVKSRDASLETARSAAEKWLGAITALTALLATVTLLKGPEAASDVDGGQRITVAGLAALALVALAYAVLKAYQAAYGRYDAFDSISTNPVVGLDLRLRTARAEAAATSHRCMKQAIISTLAGVAALALATGILWFLPSSDSAAKHVCLTKDGVQIIKIAGSSIEVNELSTGVTIANCT